MVQPRLTNIMASVKREFEVLKYVAGHPRLPLRCKFLAGFLVAYALSPIDLIPDFIPVLGQLDDLVILPIGLWVLYKMVPADIMEEARSKTTPQEKVASD